MCRKGLLLTIAFWTLVLTCCHALPVSNALAENAPVCANAKVAPQDTREAILFARYQPGSNIAPAEVEYPNEVSAAGNEGTISPQKQDLLTDGQFNWRKEIDGRFCECDQNDSSPESLFEWAIGPEQPEEEIEDDEDDTITTDRPDFTESSKTVGKGRIQLEMGYTYVRDRSNGLTRNSHSYPEMLLRIGLFTEWFELRVGQNFGNEPVSGNGLEFGSHGAEDLLLGAKFDLTEQKGWLPESSIIFQMTIPTGSDDFSSDEVMPGFNLLYSWEVVPDRIDMAGSSGMNRALDDSDDFYAELFQSFTIGYGLTDKLGMYTEWFGLFPVGASDPGAGPLVFFNGGFTYLVTNNFQLDIRAGVGLNERSDDFFTGTGFAVRY